MTPLSRAFCLSVSSAVVVGALTAVTADMVRSSDGIFGDLRLGGIEAGFLVNRLDQLFADLAFHLAMDGKERLLPLGALLLGKPDDPGFAAALDRLQRVVVGLGGDVVGEYRRVTQRAGE